MSGPEDDAGRLRGAWSAGAPAGDAGGCPADEEIWRAARGLLPAPQAARLLDHAARCPACSASFALAGEIGRHAGPPESASGRRAGARRAYALAGLAAAAALVLALLPVLRRPGQESAAPPGLAEQVTAALWRVGAGGDELLDAGAHVRPGDRLYVTLDNEVPVHLYILDRDEVGEVSVLFPVEGAQWTNPIAPAAGRRIPGETSWDHDSWEISSAGGAETLIVVAALHPVEAMQEALDAIQPAGAPDATGGFLRGGDAVEPDASPHRHPAQALARALAKLRASPALGRELLVEEIRLENPR